MKRVTILLILIFSTFLPAGYAQTAPDGLPDEPISVIMREWLAAVNSGKPAEIKKFVRSRFSANAFRFQRPEAAFSSLFIKLYEQSGGLDIVSVKPFRNPMPIDILAKSRKADRYVRITAGMDAAEPGRLSGLGFDKAQAPGTSQIAAGVKDLTEEQAISAIKNFLSERSRSGDLSGVVLVANGDRILLQQAYGLADRVKKTPNSLHTKFQLASIGKMFTAVAIGQLVSEGKLSFDATIAEVLPDYPNKDVASKVKIRHLLTHSGGFGTYFQSPGFDPKKEYPNAIAEIEVYKDEKLFFEPGTAWRYSNAGFSLLGAVIEQVTGKTYLAYFREKIFDPLGMKDTFTSAAGDRSVFYTQSPDDPMGVEPFLGDHDQNPMKLKPFGGGYSTVGDMYKFIRAYRKGELLGPGLTLELAKGRVDQDRSGAKRYGYGIVESSVNGEIVRGHAGGSRTDVEVLWDSQYTVIVMTNAIPPLVQAISNPIIDLLTRQESLRKQSTGK